MHERIVRRNNQETLRKLNLTDLQTAFFLLIIGHSCGLLVFVVEQFLKSNMWKRCKE